MGMKKILGFIAAAMALSWSLPAQAQFDPRAPLAQLISAFQNCGPPQVYQMLSPQLFQGIAQQTGGMGCYPQIRAAGPITNMVVIDQRNFPIGPLFVIRVTHQASGPVDWFMGINLMTQRVEYLNFQNVMPNTPTPTVMSGPTAPQIVNPTPTTSAPAPGPGSGGEGCSLYPAMCQGS